MTLPLALIGYGEAGRSFAQAGGWTAAVFDVDAAARARAAADGMTVCGTAAEALAGAAVVLSLVTADQAVVAAASDGLVAGAIWCDMNSVAPGTKRAAAALIAARGGRYVDVAVMAPVMPGLLDVPLLLAGADAAVGHAALAGLGFARMQMAGAAVGDAAAIKMLRSVVIKGAEAILAEALMGAARAGLVAPLLEALGPDWAGRADYALDRVMLHGARRAAEMDEVVATLEGLGLAAGMSRATAAVQRDCARGVSPDGLAAKLEMLV